ncbi:hypothetical protein RND81_08G027100 [Saponaria officinalis]|uniref:F-box domain-containing protein n=1 Tax=Saponaria officinalis TaxID=3572 RepID=A0AAW1J2I2_SAPOF
MAEDIDDHNNNDIPMEIMVDILVRLPIKSIFRFKCVCKNWYVLIQSHEFFKLHLNRSLKNNSYNCSLILPITRKLMVDGTQAVVSCLYRAYLDSNETRLDLSELTLPLSFRPFLDKISRINHRRLNNPRDEPMLYGRFDVVGSCNGLILITSGEQHIAICNPSIEHEHAFKILPCKKYSNYVPYHSYYDTEIFRKSYFENNKNYSRWFMYRAFGLGYDSISRFYKIVYLTSKRALVYSLANDRRSWRFIDLPYDVIKYDLAPSYGIPESEREKRVLMQVHGHGMSTNNHLHWNITEFDSEVFDYSRETILSFDICEEKWGEIPVLDELAIKSYIIELGVLNGCLCMLTSRGISYPNLDLWIMKEYGVKESWTKLFKVPNGSGIPLFYHKDRYEFLLPGMQYGLGWFNPKDNKIRKVEFYGCDFSGENYYSNRVRMCLESFISPFSSMK